jgi:hypothetical protein
MATRRKMSPSSGVTATDLPLLRACATGGRVEARRQFPAPHTYHVITFDPPATKPTRATAVARCVEQGWLKPVPQDSTFDSIHYHLTAEGEAALLTHDPNFGTHTARASYRAGGMR